MVYPREVLNKLKWSEGKSFEDATIWYIHRGAPGDIRTIYGRDVKNLGPGFFETSDSTIPYHRILRIEYMGEVVFDKELEAELKKSGVSSNP